MVRPAPPLWVVVRPAPPLLHQQQKQGVTQGIGISTGNHPLDPQPKSNSEYLVRNPVQAALWSYSSQKAKMYCEYFRLGRTLRP